MFSLRKIPVSIFLIFLFPTAPATSPYSFKAGAAESGTGYSCITKPDFWSSFHNQALLPLSQRSSAGISYQNSFGISELATRTAGFIISVNRAALGGFYSNFGYSDFTRHSAGLGCGLVLSDKITAGIQAEYFSEKTPGEYKERKFLTFEAGILLIPQDKVKIGVHVFNMLPNQLRARGVPMTLRTGAGIQLNNALFASLETEMSTGKSLTLKTGFEYEIKNSLLLRGGFSTDNNSFSLGTGYTIKELRIDIGFASHQNLGISSSISVIYRLKDIRI